LNIYICIYIVKCCKYITWDIVDIYVDITGMSLGYTWDVMYAANRLACKHHPTIGENIGSAAQPQLLLKVPAVLPATKSKPDLPNRSK
jgi:Fe-S-cluster containining protein